jgi:hypothetical protein
MEEILVNATIVYIDGIKERFDAIYLTDKRVITGRVSERNGAEVFEEYGFISRQNIKQIYNGCTRKMQRLTS